MPGQLNQNPSITSSRAGDRTHRGSRSPRDITGREYQRQHADNEAKKAAANLDINAIKRTEYLRGRDEGYTKGLADGWDSCIAALVAEGILDPDDDTDELAE